MAVPTYELAADVPHGTASVRVLLDFAAEHGASVERCLREAGLGGRLVDDPESGVTLAEELRLLRCILAEIGDRPGLGIDLGRRYHFTTYGIYGFALISSATFGDALRVAANYRDLGLTLGRVVASWEGDAFSWVFDGPHLPADMTRFVVEREVAAAITFVNDVLGAPTEPRSTRLSQSVPPDPAPFLELCGPGVVFGAERDEVAYDHDILRRPLPQANPATAQMCVAQCQQSLDRRTGRLGLAGRVRRQLLRDPVRFGAMPLVAAELGVSVRTLRRHLEEEGTTFRELLDEARQVLAEELLGTVGLTVAQTADRLGFSEPTSFSHAFRRWKGISPTEYRRGGRPRR